LSKNSFLGTSCLRKNDITSALIEIQSSFYSHFEANKTPFPMTYYTNIFSTVKKETCYEMLRALRRIFGRKRDEVTGVWRKLHDEELHGLYSLPSIVRVIKARRMRWAGHVAHMGEVRGAYNILVERPEGRRPLGRPRRRWEDNIKMDLGEIGFEDVDWIYLAQDRDRWRALVNTVMNLRVP
jgi:hypothetical protein